MAGNKLHQASNIDFTDPFIAGQMVGMLVILTHIENSRGISDESLQKIKRIAANNAEQYLQKPTEDIFLMVEDMVKDIDQL